MRERMKTLAISYGRTALAAMLALYMSGVSDPKILANAFIAALASPILKALDPNDHSLGIKK